MNKDVSKEMKPPKSQGQRQNSGSINKNVSEETKPPKG
jgi:hypothetical protein